MCPETSTIDLHPELWGFIVYRWEPVLQDLPSGSWDLWELVTSPPRAAPPAPGRGGRAQIGPGTRPAAPAFPSAARASAQLQPPRSRCSGTLGVLRQPWGSRLSKLLGKIPGARARVDLRTRAAPSLLEGHRCPWRLSLVGRLPARLS